ncbi:MAG: hypothetical protein IBX55_12965 [Methyloprofundus sp.]|nr:hypothetical protein [Methyloprofundus sp.]
MNFKEINLAFNGVEKAIKNLAKVSKMYHENPDYRILINLGNKKQPRALLDNLGKRYGLKRRWFGLEPNNLFRQRILKTYNFLCIDNKQ